MITQVFLLIFERQKPLFLQNFAKNSALKRLKRISNIVCITYLIHCNGNMQNKIKQIESNY